MVVGLKDKAELAMTRVLHEDTLAGLHAKQAEPGSGKSGASSLTAAARDARCALPGQRLTVRRLRGRCRRRQLPRRIAMRRGPVDSSHGRRRIALSAADVRHLGRDGRGAADTLFGTPVHRAGVMRAALLIAGAALAANAARASTTAAATGTAPAPVAAAPAPLRNPFNDPLLQATNGLPGCPVPAPPRYSAAAYAAEAHDRAQRGTSCWLAGRCRLPNAYLYDAEIVPRVKLALHGGGVDFADTSVWALGQRRIVWLKGCVARPEQVSELLRIVRDIDDVDGVESQLMVGTRGTPPYAVDDGRDATAAPTPPSSARAADPTAPGAEPRGVR